MLRHSNRDIEGRVNLLISYWNKYTTYNVEFDSYSHDVTETDLDVSFRNLHEFALNMFDDVNFYPDDFNPELRFNAKGYYFRYDGIVLEIANKTYLHAESMIPA